MSSVRTDPGPRAWAVVAMLFAFMLINFADKAVFGLAAVPIMAELHLTNAEFGRIGSAFFLLFSISAVLVGFLADRVPTRWVLSGISLVWALMQLPMAFEGSLLALIACRVVLGAGEGPAYPVALHAVYKWFADAHRTVPTSLVSVGGALGAGLAAPLLTWIIVRYSWHAAFGFLGVVSLAWTALWLAVGREGPLAAHSAAAGAGGLERVSYPTLLTARTVVGVVIACFCAYWALTLAVIWLPAFLIRAGGYSPTQAGWIVVLPSLLQALLAPSIGLASQRLMARGVGSRLARGLFGGGCVALAGLTMILLAGSSRPAVQIPLVMVTFSLGSAIFTLGPALIGEIAPVGQRGAMLGINNALFTLAGVAAPWLMGHFIDGGADLATGFRTGFAFGGTLILCGGLAAMILIHPGRDSVRFRAGRPATPAPHPTAA